MTGVASSASYELVVLDATPAPAPPHPTYLVAARPGFELERQWNGAYWIVRDLPTGIFGHAPELSDALRDFFMAVQEHLGVLQTQVKLSPELVWQLEYLRARAPR